MLNEILRLDKLIDDCLVETLKLKLTVTDLQQYEYAAQIRQMEKQFKAIRSNIAGLPYPIIPNKGLTPNAPIYSSQLFMYGQQMGWKKLPDHINLKFTNRRNELNSTIPYSDITTGLLSTLNGRLANEEDRINRFVETLLSVYKSNHLETLVDDFSYGGIIIQVLTSKEFTRSAIKNGAAKWWFYEMELPIEDWIADSKQFYEKGYYDVNDQFLNILPVNLRNDKLSYLFYYLGSNGLLALQDILNIDCVMVSFPFLCRLKRI